MRRYLLDLHRSWGICAAYHLVGWHPEGEYVPGLDGSGDCAVGLEVLAAAARMRAVALFGGRARPVGVSLSKTAC